MYKFKVSKYKNAAPKVPKKEQCITEIPCGQVMASFGNFVQVSGKHVAFNVDSGAGGCAGILPIDTVGRRNRRVPTIYAHSDFLSDMNFSPFDDDLLATCSFDGTLKLWHIPDGFEDTLDTPLSKMRLDEELGKRLDIVRFHPTANEVLACSSHDVVHFIDLSAGETMCSVPCREDVQFMSMDWKLDGKIMISSCKDTTNRVLDPRENAVSMTFPGFAGFKDSRILWMGDLDYIVGAGFTKQRNRVLTLWDIRNPSVYVSEEEIDQGSGSLMLFHDIDTNLVMLGGKGDTFIKLLEFNTDTTQLSFSSQQALGQQSFGLGMAPKRVLDVMNGEVNRMFQLAKNMIVPLPYIIPRKSYREFQPDLFPDTVYSGKPSLSASEWFNGENKEVIKLSLDPKFETSKPAVAGLKGKVNKERESVESISNDAKESKANNDFSLNKSTLPVTADENSEDVQKIDHLVPETTKPIKKVSASFSDNSKYKYILGEAMHKSNNIENVKNISESLPMESDGIQAYKDFVALPLSGAGGQISIIQVCKPGRLPDSDVPALENSSNVLDFAMDPFKRGRIVAACEDWKIRVWSELPADGLTETEKEPAGILLGHQNRVTIVKFHPYASDILVSASQDLTLRIWDLSDPSGESHVYEGHTDQILCLDWHPEGEKIATLCRDKKIRIYEPLQDLDPIMEFEGPEARGARICWCGPENNWLIVSSSFGSGRAFHLYNSDDFKLLASLDDLGDSSSVLTLHYDESTSVLFASGKGERMIYCFEISEKSPYLHSLSHVRFTDLHQGVKFLQKNVIDVRRVEIARAVRLTKSHMELVSFTIPRVKTEYFQDDVIPKVRITWEPVVNAEFWADGNVDENGSRPVQDWISLKPADMKNLSEAPQEAPKASKYCSRDILAQKTDEEKKAELIDAMMNKLDLDDKLEQDDFEGVDEDEWDD